LHRIHPGSLFAEGSEHLVQQHYLLLRFEKVGRNQRFEFDVGRGSCLFGQGLCQCLLGIIDVLQSMVECFGERFHCISFLGIQEKICASSFIAKRRFDVSDRCLATPHSAAAELPPAANLL